MIKFAANNKLSLEPLFSCRLLNAVVSRSCVLIVGSSLLFSLQAHAQSRADMQLLVFDAVPIAITPPQEDSTAAPVIAETSSLPQGNAVELRSWLTVNRPMQSLDENALDRDIAGYQEAITALELAEGPFSANLPQQLLALGIATQNKGELDIALDHFEQASHVTRINQGLFSTQQIPIIERIIDNHVLRGNLVAADEQQNYLFFLQQKNYGTGSTDLLPALHRYAEWNVYAFSSGAQIAAASNIVASQDASTSITVNEASFRVARLVNAQHIYWSIIEILLNNFGKDDPRLLDAEMRLALTNYLYATSFATQTDPLAFSDINAPLAVTSSMSSPPSVSHMGYRHGRDALSRRRDYLNEMPDADPLDQIRASLDVADWMLFFSTQRLKALEMYAEVFDASKDKLPAEQLDAIFSPALPEHLPAFIQPMNSRASLGIPDDLTLDYQGYIDVEFDLNRFGKTQSIKILGKSGQSGDAVEQRLVRNLRRTQFRPRLENGVPRIKDTLQVRYYYTW